MNEFYEINELLKVDTVLLNKVVYYLKLLLDNCYCYSYYNYALFNFALISVYCYVAFY